mmetsp:Transcript_13601/g.39214  ORF Transcript_13601/g.39214 Transcript_13601/m.39214 type:complete len:255 (+) Transcript_13601:299-1063(+)
MQDAQRQRAVDGRDGLRQLGEHIDGADGDATAVAAHALLRQNAEALREDAALWLPRAPDGHAADNHEACGVVTSARAVALVVADGFLRQRGDAARGEVRMLTPHAAGDRPEQPDGVAVDALVVQRALYERVDALGGERAALGALRADRDLRQRLGHAQADGDGGVRREAPTLQQRDAERRGVADGLSRLQRHRAKDINGLQTRVQASTQERKLRHRREAIKRERGAHVAEAGGNLPHGGYGVRRDKLVVGLQRA